MVVEVSITIFGAGETNKVKDGRFEVWIADEDQVGGDEAIHITQSRLTFEDWGNVPEHDFDRAKIVAD